MSARKNTIVFIGNPHGRFNLQLHLNTVRICFLLLVACTLLAVIALRTGTLDISHTEIINALTGQGSKQLQTIVNQWRLPRIILAIILGAALGMSGAIFQSLLRNPLGSPDIIGFNTGAYTGALVVIILLNGSFFQIALGALCGGLLATALVYLLAYKKGIHGFRLIIVGIGISAMLSAVNIWLSISSSLSASMSAAIWGAGTLNGMTWAKGLPAILMALMAMLIVFRYARPMKLLEMGDDVAGSLGIAAERTRLILMILGVVLTASVTAAAGPISFIALAAPQLAQKILKTHSILLLPSALMGGFLLLASDFIAQHLFTGIQLPVGVVTVSIGGVYLIWLLIRESKY